MSREFIVSVVIPTRNRAEYAFGAVKQVLSSGDADLQLVVQDNSDDDSLSRMCAPYLADPRLTYNHCPEKLSFVDNFSEGVALAEGEYVCLLGDDDGINPELLEVARWASRSDVRAVKPGLQVLYLWPGASLPGEADDGQLIVHTISQDVHQQNTDAELVKLVRRGGQDYLDLDLAKLYHGLVRRDALEQVKSVTGRYFGGLSPDIYAAVALSTVIDKVVCLDYPLTISGICRKSGSADSATGRHTGKLSDAPHFVGHESYEWSSDVPQFYSVETIWADSSLAAIREMNRPELLAAFKPEALAAYCLHRHPEFRGLIQDHYTGVQNARGVSRMRARSRLLRARCEVPLRDLAVRVKRKLTGSARVVTRISGIPNVESAARELTGLLKAEGLNVDHCLGKLDLPTRAGTEGQ